MHIVEISPDKIREGMVHLKRWFKEHQTYTEGKDPTIIVALEDDLPIGIAAYHGPRVYYVSVEPSNRGCGVGKRLIEYIAAQCRTSLIAYVPPYSKEALASFIKWRFVFTGFYMPHDCVNRESAYVKLELKPTTGTAAPSDMFKWKELDLVRDEVVVIQVLPTRVE